jgi:hypothetical protein
LHLALRVKLSPVSGFKLNAIANQESHGFDFRDAEPVFYGSTATVEDKRNYGGEHLLPTTETEPLLEAEPMKNQVATMFQNLRVDVRVDSTGIKFLYEGEWKRKKHGAAYRRRWRQVHLDIDAHTLEIHAIEVTDNSVGDAPTLPELPGQIAPDETVASVRAGTVPTTPRRAMRR